MNTRQRTEMFPTYEFTLTFSLPPASEDPEQYLEHLAENGCDDATVGIGTTGRIALAFAREARSAEAAILTALRNVKTAIPGATLVEANPDLVGLTDIADLLGFSRQNMRKLQVTNAASFPPPVHEGSSALWHLATVLEWFQLAKTKAIDETLLQVAQVAMQVNFARDSRLLDKQLQAKLGG
jgi:predicted DNA-binding transcriptional regulator AlpA